MAEQIKTVTVSLNEYIKSLKFSEETLKAIKERRTEEIIYAKMRDWGLWK